MKKIGNISFFLTHKFLHWFFNKKNLNKTNNTDDKSCSVRLDEIKSEIYSYNNLHDNWDTYGGIKPSKYIIDFVINLLEKLYISKNISIYNVSPISGGVYIEFRNKNQKFCFEIDDNDMLFFIEDNKEIIFSYLQDITDNS